ncbi:unnamed protein product, partial [Mesorhabditis belari]|uniref:Uncharacterized protein n=1 Tax=Mesorhabditis belari TaxID=2138241 RepID=A0AAF3EYU3_9BILA
MSDKPESSKTQLETLEADRLEKLSAKPSPVLTKRANIQVELNQKLLELLEEGTDQSREQAKKLLIDRNALLVAGDANTQLEEDIIEPLFQKDFLSQLPEETWRRKCLEKGYVEYAPSFRFLGGWATNRADEQAGITICSHMDLQEAHQNRREREDAYGQCYERSSWKSLYLRKKRIISNWRSRAIQSSTVLRSGHIVAGNDRDNTLRIWNVDDAQPAFTLTGHMDGVRTSQVSDDGKYIVSGSTDQTVLCVKFDGERVVSSGNDFNVKVWNVQTGECLHTLTGHNDSIESLLFEPERDLVVSGGRDGTMRVWDVRRGTCIAILVTHQNSCSDVQLRRNILVSCYTDSDVGVWDIRDGGSRIHLLQDLWDVDKVIFVRDLPAFTLTGHMGHILTFQVSDDGEYIVSGSSDQTVRVWCGQTGVQRYVLQGHTGTVKCISLHGTTLVSGSHDQTLRVWDIVDGKCLHILTGHLAEVRFVLFDGKRVVSSADGDDFTVKVWNAHTEECLHMLTGHTDIILSLLFESERDLVVSGSRDGTIRVWDVRRGTCIAHLVFHQGSQPSGDFEVWDIRDGGSCTHRLREANGRTSNITSLQLLDSGLLVTGSMDGSVMLWDVDKGIFVRDLVRLASCGYGGYNWLLKATETLLVGAFEARLARSTNLMLIDFDASYP